MSFEIKSNFGLAPDIIMLSDSESAIARITNDLGLDVRSELQYQAIIDLKEALGSHMTSMLYVNDEFNYSDVLTKWHPLESPKMQHFADLARTGQLKIPLDAFRGRSNLSTKQMRDNKIADIEQKIKNTKVGDENQGAEEQGE